MQLDFEDFNFRIFLATRRDMAIAIALGAVAVMLVLFAVIPQAQEAYTIYQKLDAEKPKLAKLTAKLQELKDIVFTPEYSQISMVHAALPSRKPLLELLTGLNTVTTQTAVSIKSFEINPGLIASGEAEPVATTQGPYDKLTLELEILGTVESIQEFMVQLETISPFTTITSVELSTAAADSSGLELQQARLTTETYYFTQPIKVTIDAPLPKISATQQETLKKLEEFSVTELPSQTEIRGGGRDDLFGVEPLF